MVIFKYVNSMDIHLTLQMDPTITNIDDGGMIERLSHIAYLHKAYMYCHAGQIHTYRMAEYRNPLTHSVKLSLRPNLLSGLAWACADSSRTGPAAEDRPRDRARLQLPAVSSKALVTFLPYVKILEAETTSRVADNDGTCWLKILPHTIEYQRCAI